MGKLEKLKEVNIKIKKIIDDLETDIFIKKINVVDNDYILNYNQKVSNLK